MKRTIFVCTVLGATLVAGAAFAQQQWQGTYTPAMPRRADDVDNIGSAGQIVFGVERVTGVYFDRDKTDWTDSTTGAEMEETLSTTSVGLFGMSAAPGGDGVPTPSSVPRLALDYLVTDGISLGGSLTYVSHSADLETVTPAGETSVGAGTVSVFNINPRVGYAFPFDETFGLWPRAGVAFASRNADFEILNPLTGAVVDTGDLTITTWQLTLDAMVIISPFSHFAILIGPYVDIGLGGSYEATVGSVTDERNANLLSFGGSVAIVGYY